MVLPLFFCLRILSVICSTLPVVIGLRIYPAINRYYFTSDISRLVRRQKSHEVCHLVCRPETSHGYKFFQFVFG